ncbi:succinylglutamate desuccinylase [Rhodoferax lacus]|uniref:Succinylglutamate desuccinylase n=1 Tax=Rhodoferax lacus TaxID=2184758 RepID=A0A3E1RGY8_9BURK|nr:succinylglutamate desuccinylase/aspartoacylase family protein [Rhodoferax lacus]RFO98513.1 succinylglutamate desuccinylase [Rhodoferax lacus]
MQRIDHPLLSPSLGSHKTLTSFHFGKAGSGLKIYIQASLHAEELPGMLVAYHLRPLLEAAEAAGQVVGEVVLVPVSNPIGLSQRLDHKPMGRFELDSSENFNRNYPDFAKAVLPALTDKLGADPAANVRMVRQAMAAHLASLKPATELQSLRQTLLGLAFDADIVLDLHCDCEGVMHFYCEESCWPQLAPIAHFMGSQAILLAKDSGGGPIDEALSGTWWRLAEALKHQGLDHPLPQGCCTTTIELRGELDVTHAYAMQDARSIFSYLEHLGVLATGNTPAVPAALCQPTPLAGSETLRATGSGVVVYAAQPGQTMKTGELVAEVINPLDGVAERVLAGVDGVFYARILNRYVTAGCEVGKIAGATPFRTGSLLGN